MDNFEENEIKIANYLDEKMSAAEEEAFMQELGNNHELRAQYEDELLMLGLLGDKKDEKKPSEPDIFFQSADEHMAMLEKAIEKNEKAPVVPKFNKYKLLAAASVLIILGALIFMIAARKKNEQVPIVKNNIKTKDNLSTTIISDSLGVVHTTPYTKNNIFKDSIKKINNDSNNNLPLPHLADNIKAQQLFDHFNTPYNEGADDPVQASMALLYYNSHKFDKLLAVKDDEMQEMGADAHEAIAKVYLHFYKGLAYLAIGQPEDAIQLFKPILQTASTTEPLYYKVEWYNTLAYLKLNAIAKTVEMTQKITKTRSPYKQKAIELLNALNAK